jgi:uncharacterized cupredoxin-like copper-binding protein
MIIGATLILVLIVGLISGKAGPGMHGGCRHVGCPKAASSPKGAQLVSRGIGGPADASAATRTIEVTALDTLSFEPARITVSTGEVVTFVVTNNGQSPHEFTLGDAAMQQQHAQAMSHMPAGAAHDMPNSITLEPGETKRLTWRFGDAAIEYACHVQGHYQAGMRGQITVA